MLSALTEGTTQLRKLRAHWPLLNTSLWTANSVFFSRVVMVTSTTLTVVLFCYLCYYNQNCYYSTKGRVSVQGVKSLGSHLCRGFEFYGVRKKNVINFQKENGNTFTRSIIFTVKSLQKEQNSTNLLLWPPIYRNKPAITPKWSNSLDTNSNQRAWRGPLAANSVTFVII